MAITPTARFSVLVVDDDPILLSFITACLAGTAIDVLTADKPEEGLRIVEDSHPTIVIVDWKMPQIDGIEFIERALAINPETCTVWMTARYSDQIATEAITRGAAFVISKPLSRESLISLIEKALRETHDRQVAEAKEIELLQASRFENLIGRSPEMLSVFTKIRHIAPHFRTALVTGPTGTGKELVAHALHNQSPVANAPFAVLNCSAIVDTLFESELFGHVKGAFTGATQDKAGVFEYANGGTVFLDEIGELPMAMQAKLLRVLQQQEIQRVGSPQPKKVDVRIVAATNRDLREMVKTRQFREDLFYRLAMVEVRIPPLCRRSEDLQLLLRFMIDKYARMYQKNVVKMTLRCQQLLMRYEWPGNVREVENVIGSACMMAQGSLIDVKDLPESVREPVPSRSSEVAEIGGDVLPLHEMERRYARQVLAKFHGNKLRTAEALGIGRATLYRLLAEEEEPAAAPRAAAAVPVQ